MKSSFFPAETKVPLLGQDAHLCRLRTTFGGHTVFLFGDAPDDFAIGGNKVRFYEFLLPDILQKKPQVLLTSGSLYSNHIRVSAEIAKRYGMECHLILTADHPGEEYLAQKNNLSLAVALGAKCVFAGGFAAMLKIEEYKKQLTQQGISYYHVPNAGHAPGAFRAYADVMGEAYARLSALSVSPSRIFLPCASGTTAAGVMEGAALLRSAGTAVPDVTVFRVSNSPRGAERGIRELLRGAEGYPGALACDSLPEIADCGKNDYGKPDAELLALREQIFREEGVLLDRTYNINAFYGMVKSLEAHPGTSDVLYLHTGGFSE